MKAGNFNIKDYLEKLYEEATPMMDGGENLTNAEGIVIPDTNKKSYDWLKKEYDSKQTEVKVEITGQGASFKPGYDLQTNLDSVKDFKPGMYGEVKTADNEGTPKKPGVPEKGSNLDSKKDKPSFQPGEGEAEKKELPKTKAPKEDIKNKEEGEEKEEPKEKEEPEEKESGEKPEVKKIDLKTKKK